MTQPTPLLPEPYRGVVRLFEVACEEVVRVATTGVEGAERGHLFELLAPGGQFGPGDVGPYRAHCRELLDRLGGTPGEMAEPTEAEMLMLLERTARVGVLSSTGDWLRQVLEARVRHGRGVVVPYRLQHALRRTARSVPRTRVVRS